MCFHFGSSFSFDSVSKAAAAVPGTGRRRRRRGCRIQALAEQSQSLLASQVAVAVIRRSLLIFCTSLRSRQSAPPQAQLCVCFVCVSFDY